jgi:MEMO1 family protein
MGVRHRPGAASAPSPFQKHRAAHTVRAMSTLPPQYRTRPPAVAGAFYPGTRPALQQEVAARLGSAQTTPRPGLRGIIAPHAGYVYSGAVAAEAYAAARGGGFARALIVGPAHYISFRGLAAPAHAAFHTPLGEAPLDGAVVQDLVAAGLAVADDVPHAPEHAVEVELPFLQALFGELPIVPVLFGTTSADSVTEVIARVWTDDTLLVISSDLSHFEPHAAAQVHDARTAAAIERLDADAIGPRDACGHLAVRGALSEVRRRGLAVERLALRTSGDAAGGRTSVIGYGAWALVEA